MFSGFALVVSVDCTSTTHTSDLARAVKADGDDVASLLSMKDVCGYEHDRMTRLDGVEATTNRVTEALTSISTRAREDDPVLFFFSGHGAIEDPADSSRSCLALSGYDPSTRDGVLGTDMLNSLWTSIPSKRKLFVVDACFSGGLQVPKGQGATDSLNPAILKTLASGTGTVAIASSRSDQTSIFNPTNRNSLFTKHLLEGLRGAAGHDKQGFVRVFDLFTYVAENVRREHPNQAPVYSAHEQDSNFPVVFCRDPALRKSRRYFNLPGTSPRDPNGLTEMFAALYPLGPLDLSIWERAGGDSSRLTLTGNGRSDWYMALKLLRLGGGGVITITTLVGEALTDYPRHKQLSAAANWSE